MITLENETVIGAEALPSLTSAATLFPNAPIGTNRVRFTLRGAGMTMSRKVGTVPTALGVGIDYPLGTYVISASRAEILAIKAIESASTATGYAEYINASEGAN